MILILHKREVCIHKERIRVHLRLETSNGEPFTLEMEGEITSCDDRASDLQMGSGGGPLGNGGDSGGAGE